MDAATLVRRDLGSERSHVLRVFVFLLIGKATPLVTERHHTGALQQ